MPDLARVKSREKVRGVKNFGRITPTLFRGGKVRTKGLKNLRTLGVRTVINVARNPSKEKKVCRRLGMTFHSFPMDSRERPDDRSVQRILQILRDAEGPVYVHCSQGRHRAGTIGALYRIRVQGWPPGRAWAEQESYGFGSARKHRELYEYVYGRNGAARSKSRDRD